MPKQQHDKNATQSLRLMVEFTVTNFASIQDVEDMGGLENAVKVMVEDNGLFGVVEDDYKIAHKSLIADTDCGMYCSGCFQPLTLENIGGYRCYCQQCLEKFPPFPDDGQGHNIVGIYPNFKWQ